MSRKVYRMHRRAYNFFQKYPQRPESRSGRIFIDGAVLADPETSSDDAKPIPVEEDNRKPVFIQVPAQLEPSEVAIIYRSELEFVSRCILDYPNIETGGQMFGYWTDDGTPVVLYTIGPGPRANHERSFFNQDVAYLESVGNMLIQKYGLQHIGEWHSHHKLGFAHPSGNDAASMAHGIAVSGRNRFLLCICNYADSSKTMLNPFNFVTGRGDSYVNAQWIVKPKDSPFRALIDAEQRSMLSMPKVQQANYVGMDSLVGAQSPARKADFDNRYWLANKANNLVLKSIIDFLNEDPNVSNLKPMMDEYKRVQLKFVFNRTYMAKVIFPDRFPYEPPVYWLIKRDWMGNENRCVLDLPDWNYTGDIYESFVNYYKNIRIL